MSASSTNPVARARLMRRCFLSAGLLAALVGSAASARAACGEPRAAEPRAATQDRLRRVLRDALPSRYDEASPLEKADLADELVDGALGAASLDERFVMLSEAIELASDSGDGATVVRALQAMAERHETNVGERGERALMRVERALRASGAFECHPVHWLVVSDLALAEVDLAGAGRAINRGQSRARAAKERELERKFEAREADFRQRRALAVASAAALLALDKDPTHRPSQRAVGSYLCLVRREWPAGLMRWSTGDDARLADFARRDFLRPASPEQQLALADGWWRLGEAQSAVGRASLWERAAQWYEKALDSTSGIERARVQQRLAVARALLAPPVYGLVDETLLLESTPFHLGDKSRTQKHELVVPPLSGAHAQLDVRVSDMGDNSADGGMHFELRNALGEVVLRRFSRASGAETFTWPVRAGSKWTAVLEDLDTRGDGNGGWIQAWVRPQ